MDAKRDETYTSTNTHAWLFCNVFSLTHVHKVLYNVANNHFLLEKMVFSEQPQKLKNHAKTQAHAERET